MFRLWAMLQYITRAKEAIQNQLLEASETKSSWKSIGKFCLNLVVKRPMFVYRGSYKLLTFLRMNWWYLTQLLFWAFVSSAKDKIILLDFIGLDPETQKEMHSMHPK